MAGLGLEPNADIGSSRGRATLQEMIRGGEEKFTCRVAVPGTYKSTLLVPVGTQDLPERFIRFGWQFGRQRSTKGAELCGLAFLAADQVVENAPRRLPHRALVHGFFAFAVMPIQLLFQFAHAMTQRFDFGLFTLPGEHGFLSG
jgi:hypothetical protein